MTQRFLVYPVLFLSFWLLVLLLFGRDRRWYVAQIAQLSLVLLASLGAIYFVDDVIWVVLAWSFLVIFVIVPRSLARLAAQWLLLGHWAKSARMWKLAARFSWGQTGQLYRRYAVVLDCLRRVRRDDAFEFLDRLLAEPMPASVRGAVRVWKLTLLAARRDWERAVAFYESVDDWATSLSATQARLLGARAYAETGSVARGLRCLQFVALSPRTLGPLESQLWMTRVRLAAIAGDSRELETLLAQRRMWQRGFERAAAYWRGRCALAWGNQAEAVKLLTRAYAMTDLRDHSWRDAIRYYLERAQSGAESSACTGDREYALALEALHTAEAQTAPWRGLMHLGRPEAVTVALLAVMVSVFVGAKLAFGPAIEERFWLVVGNGPETWQRHQWWRLVTALFVHANWLHLLMNGAMLWLFGSSVEKTMGRWRFVAIFLLAGVFGNSLSALNAHYDNSIGASSGIYGLVGVFAVAMYRLDGPIHAGLRRRLLAFLVVMIAGDLTIGWLEPVIDNLAHAGGFLGGIALAFLLQPRRRRTPIP